MNGSTLVKVARFHLADRTSYTALPWGILAVNFAIYLAGAASAGGGAQIPTANIAAIYLFFIAAGALSIFRSLPFAFALGVSRRSYYAGTALLAVGLAAPRLGCRAGRAHDDGRADIRMRGEQRGCHAPGPSPVGG